MAYSSTIQPQQQSDQDTVPARSFVATYVESRRNPDGTQVVTKWSTRYVKADGEWRIVMHGMNKEPNADSPVFAGKPDGLVGRGSDGSIYRSTSIGANRHMWEYFRSPGNLQKHPEFVRKEVFVGLTVFLHRAEISDPDHPLAWVERSFSPETGYVPLRTVMHFRDGSEIIQEAIRVEFKDVPENLNADIN
jgi:hypothetical protein